MSLFDAFRDQDDDEDWPTDDETWESWWCKHCRAEWSFSYTACPECDASAPAPPVTTRPTPSASIRSRTTQTSGAVALLAAARDIIAAQASLNVARNREAVEDQGFFLDARPNGDENTDDSV